MSSLPAACTFCVLGFDDLFSFPLNILEMHVLESDLSISKTWLLIKFPSTYTGGSGKEGYEQSQCPWILGPLDSAHPTPPQLFSWPCFSPVFFPYSVTQSFCSSYRLPFVISSSPLWDSPGVIFVSLSLPPAVELWVDGAKSIDCAFLKMLLWRQNKSHSIKS